MKKSYKKNKFKISAPTRKEDLNYLIDYILYQIFKINLNILKKTWRKDC